MKYYAEVIFCHMNYVRIEGDYKQFDKLEFYARVAICKVLGKSLDELFWEES